MTAPILKSSLGDGGAAMDESHGAPNRLLPVLQAMAKETGLRLRIVSTPTVSVLDSTVLVRDGVLQFWNVAIADTGSGNSTDLELQVNGTPVATVSVDNTYADDLVFVTELDPPVQVNEGDTVSVEATAIATGVGELTSDFVVQAVGIE